MILAEGKRTNPTKSLFEVDLVFSLILGANMPPFSLPKSTKIASKPHLGMHRCFDRSWHRFFNELGSILEANLAPCWPLFLQSVGNEFLVHPVFCWVYVLFRFFGRPDPLLAKNVARGSRFWKVLGSILEGFGLHFGGFC